MQSLSAAEVEHCPSGCAAPRGRTLSAMRVSVGLSSARNGSLNTCHAKQVCGPHLGTAMNRHSRRVRDARDFDAHRSISSYQRKDDGEDVDDKITYGNKVMQSPRRHKKITPNPGGEALAPSVCSPTAVIDLEMQYRVGRRRGTGTLQVPFKTFTPLRLLVSGQYVLVSRAPQRTRNLKSRSGKCPATWHRQNIAPGKL